MRKPEAWILTVGNEIINGVITDTNRQAMARELRSAGIAIRGMSSVGDDLEAIAEALGTAMDKAAITLVSGGLGPTQDDMTAEAAALFIGAPLESNPEQLAAIEERFRNWGRPMSPSNAKQALFPAGSAPIPNDYGTAPGFVMENSEGAMALFFPGIPREMIRMLRERALPMIASRHTDLVKSFKNRTLQVYGISESKLGELLAEIAQETESFRLAFLPRFPIIRLRLDASADSEDEAERILDLKQQAISEIIPENIISDNGRPMEKVTLDLLEARGLSLALAESITGGLIGEMITRVPGSSATFMGSIVSYSNHLKTSILGVSPDTINSVGAVSHRCAVEMAVGAQKAASAAVALSVTGIAGPAGGTKEKPVGTFIIGLATPEVTLSRRFLLPGPREWVKTLAAMQALDLLRRHLLGYRIHGEPGE